MSQRKSLNKHMPHVFNTIDNCELLRSMAFLGTAILLFYYDII